MSARQDLTGAVDLVQSYTLCNVQREQQDYNSDHEVFTVEYMGALAGFNRDLLKSGNHWHLFCSDAQFSM